MSFLIENKRPIIAIVVTCVVGWFFSFIATRVYIAYAYGLFVWLPVVLGALATILYAYKNEVSKKSCKHVSFLTLLFFCLGLLTFAFEGVICIIMAAPIGLFFTWLGHLLGYNIVKSKIINPALLSIILIISVPVFMGFDYYNKNDNEDIRSVTTRIVINSSAEKVWKTVIAFPKLKEPTELLFKAGIAYPINARINGKGVGAIRNCIFSTGSFVEPITEWKEPNLLRFNVVEQPATMKELSFYDLYPNHLHGYFVSKHGQFKLKTLPNGSTLLEGTTWYYNNIKPNVYWTLWSDVIIHKIHERVLNHIKEVAEKQSK